MKIKKLLSILLTVAMMSISVVGCGNQPVDTSSITETVQEEETTVTEQTSVQSTQEATENNSLRLEDDFYAYVTADFLPDKEIPATEPSWDWFTENYLMVQEFMDDYLDNLSNDSVVYEKGTSEQKIKDLYELFADTQNRDETGIAPLQEYIDLVRNAKDIDEFVDAVTACNGKYGLISIVAGAGAGVDLADSSKYVVYIEAADTFIGRDYLDSSDAQEYVDYYLGYIKDIFMEYGMSEEEATQSRDNVEKLWREICSASLTAEESADINMLYNVFTEDTLQDLYTNVDVPKMLKALNVDGQEQYIISDVGQCEMVNSLLVEDNLDALKDYFTYVILDSTSSYRSTKAASLVNDCSNFFNGTESETDEEIWKHDTESWLSWELGIVYVQDHFSQEDKEAVINIVEQLVDEYEKIIDRQDWMSDATKENAKKKLETMTLKIGYPDEWPKYMDLTQITPLSEGGSLLSNLLDDMEAQAKYNISLLGTQVDKSEWEMTPQTVNAYYSPSNNEIVFPAAILQAPFYSSDYTDAQNMGGIGFVIGHEISHAFDSTGSYFDENGNYNDWWTEEDRENYENLKQSISDYYSQYEVNGLNVNGVLTVGEDIADLGAVTCVTSILAGDTEALKEAMTQVAYVWASKSNDSYLIYLINNDTHAPAEVRANAALSSCDAFYEVYGIKEGDGMYVAPEDRVGIWR
jgi:putative endopeptidase